MVWLVWCVSWNLIRHTSLRNTLCLISSFLLKLANWNIVSKLNTVWVRSSETRTNPLNIPYSCFISNQYRSCIGPLSAFMGLHWSSIVSILHVYREVQIYHFHLIPLTAVIFTNLPTSWYIKLRHWQWHNVTMKCITDMHGNSIFSRSSNNFCCKSVL